MKNRIIAALALLAIGCTKESVNVNMSPSTGETVSLEISVPLPATKVTDISSEESVNSLQVFMFRQDGTLEAYAQGETASLTFEATTGGKKIAALVNSQSFTDVRSLAELENKVSSLEDNAPGRLVMYGAVDAEISTASSSVVVPVSRLVARLSVSKITNRFELEQYQGQPIQLKGIYLVNAAGDMKLAAPYTPVIWYNKGLKEGEGDLPSMLYSGPVSDGNIGYNTSYETEHYFYCYPNSLEEDNTSYGDWQPGFTRIVVEALIAGKTYYYPVSIENIESNHTYTVSELVITRLGSDSPDRPVSKGSASFSITVQPWEEGFNGSVSI